MIAKVGFYALLLAVALAPFLGGSGMSCPRCRILGDKG